MNSIIAAALELQSFCSSRKWDFSIIGGLAVQRWGEPRNTIDADLTLITGFGREEEFVDELLTKFVTRRPDARDFALQYRVLLLQASNGIPLDIALGAMPFEVRSVERATAWQVANDASLITVCPEDLIVHKAFAGRPRDWLDIEGVLVVSGDSLDWQLIEYELRPLIELKECPEAFDQLMHLKQKFSS